MHINMYTNKILPWKETQNITNNKKKKKTMETVWSSPFSLAIKSYDALSLPISLPQFTYFLWLLSCLLLHNLHSDYGCKRASNSTASNVMNAEKAFTNNWVFGLEAISISPESSSGASVSWESNGADGCTRMHSLHSANLHWFAGDYCWLYRKWATLERRNEYVEITSDLTLNCERCEVRNEGCHLIELCQ